MELRPKTDATILQPITSLYTDQINTYTSKFNNYLYDPTTLEAWEHVPVMGS